MRTRSFGLITLSFTLVMVALHAQMGSVALIMTGSAFASLGSMEGAATLVLGAGYLGLTFAAYVVAYGAWTRKHWAWAGGAVVFGGLTLASVLLMVLSGSLMAAPLPILATVAGLYLLTRPAIKEELLGTQAVVDGSTTADAVGVPGPAL